MRTIDGVDAVRVATIFGGYTRYARNVAQEVHNQGLLTTVGKLYDWDLTLPKEVYQVAKAVELQTIINAFTVTPNIYHFHELTVLADGRRAVRLLDASAYPRHVLYTEGIRWDLTTFNYDTESFMDWKILAFFAQASVPVRTPYYAPKSQYLDVINGGVVGEVEQKFAEFVGDIPGFETKDYKELVPPRPLLVHDPDGVAPIGVLDPFKYKM